MNKRKRPEERRQADIAKALRAIEREETVCFDVAADSGQMFDNVKHMRWFIEAVADAVKGLE